MIESVLFIISQLHKGGAESSLVCLINQLANQAYDVSIVILNQVPISGAISLIPKLRKEVHVLDAYKKANSHTRVGRKLYRMLFGIADYPMPAVRFVEGNVYDLAVHVGEWCAPDFLTDVVQARRKAVWLHTDINNDTSFDPNRYFACYEKIDHVLFVSQHSLQASAEMYPLLKRKAGILHNAVDIESILNMGSEAAPLQRELGKPLIVTISNIRPEKGHMRQVEAMHLLKLRGRDFYWWNIGYFDEASATVKSIRHKIREYDLQDRFLLLGATENPYAYINQADVVACLSDYESWSMVITEALTLNTPVICTPTSGAIEQIQDGVNGWITDFSIDGIANRLETALFSMDARYELQHNNHAAKPIPDAVHELALLMNTPCAQAKKPASALFVFDDVNYLGGAHSASIQHIKYLRQCGVTVDVYSKTSPAYRVRQLLPDCCFITYQHSQDDVLFIRRLADCLTDRKLSKAKRSLRRAKKKDASTVLYARYTHHAIQCFHQYHTVCVISESSIYKEALVKCTAQTKVQWIHTDYCYWRNLTDWTKQMSERDGALWEKIDWIVVLAEKFKHELAALYPHLRDKIIVISNQIDEKGIREKAKLAHCAKGLKIVSCSRLSVEKNFSAMIHVMKKIAESGRSFDWTIIGDGEDLNATTYLVRSLGLTDCIHLVGYQSNPYPLIAQSDIFMQFSYYEGLPLSIYEAMILGKPVLATDVGGISEQITPGENGWLIDATEEALYKQLMEIINHPEVVSRFTSNLKNYSIGNEKAQRLLLSLFREG